MQQKGQLDREQVRYQAPYAKTQAQHGWLLGQGSDFSSQLAPPSLAWSKTAEQHLALQSGGTIMPLLRKLCMHKTIQALSLQQE